jgi:2-octaprenyl-6-methoxyphenol hydroxylase
LTKRHLGRCFFVGDSFHSIHPVAGQSFNMTLSDIKKLESYIQDCIKSGIDFGFEVHLQTLSRKLIKNHIAMTIATDGLVRLFSNNSQIIKFARSFGLDVFSSVSFLKKAAINKATNWK